jgi:histidine ammonia-lyase
VQDRYLAPDLAETARLVRDGALVGAVPESLLAEVQP